MISLTTAMLIAGALACFGLFAGTIRLPGPWSRIGGAGMAKPQRDRVVVSEQTQTLLGARNEGAMTEAVWLASNDPVSMLEWLLEGRHAQYGAWRPNTASDRKLRLFACACCRSSLVFQPLPSQWDKEAVEDAEEWAETGQRPDRESAHYANGPGWCLLPDAMEAAKVWAFCANEKAARKRQVAALIREIFGNPFRAWHRDGSLLFAPGHYRVTADGQRSHVWDDCSRWLTRTVVSVARHIYDDQDFEAMPALADALMDAGCDYEDLLQHLNPGPGRTPAHVLALQINTVSGGCCERFADQMACDCLEQAKARQRSHVRGCWAIDLLLGKS